MNQSSNKDLFSCFINIYMYVVVFAKLITVSTYIGVLPWNLHTMILGLRHRFDLDRTGVKGLLGVIDLVKFLKCPGVFYVCGLKTYCHRNSK